MTEFHLVIEVSSKTSKRARKELEQLESAWVDWDNVQMMQLRSLKYVPTILYTSEAIFDDPLEYRFESFAIGIGLPSSYFEEVGRVFNSLMERVKVRLRRKNEMVKHALWPSETLDLKEVQDEVNWLVTKALMSRENPEDRKLAEKFLPYLHYINLDEKLTFDEKIDKVIEDENEWSKELGSFLSKASEAHKKHPNARFWLYVMML
jgi:hypothetical protein